MSTAAKKDKLIESAQKFMLKGQIDRAIKEYEQLKSLDSADMRNRQKLAELLVRVNRRDEAVKEFEAIGKYYADHAYYLKAIAVYKQIQKLDPANIAVTLQLGSLNEQQGMIGNALAEYSQVLSIHERAGAFSDAVKILEMMVNADPENQTVRSRYAETLHRAGEHEKSFQEFTSMAQLLAKRGDDAGASKICGRMAQLFPDRPVYLLEILRVRVARGECAEAIHELQEVLAQDRNNLDAWLLLADAHRGSGDLEGLKTVLQLINTIFPEELAGWRGLVEIAVGEGDAEQGLRLLESATPAFLGQGAGLALLRLFELVREIAPEKITLLQSLKGVYESLGDNERADEVAVRILTMSGSELLTQPQQQEPEIAEPPAPAAVFTEQCETETAADDWDDIDLEGLEGEGLSAEGAPTDVGATGEVDRGSEPDFADLDLELELDIEEAPSQAAADDFRNLGAELLAEASEEDKSPKKRDKYCVEGLISQFKKGVDEQIDETDSESHYNLGIAYKEMGLYREAVVELQVAARDPARRFDCLVLEGICHRESGDTGKAEEVFRNGLNLPGIPLEAILPLKYELANLYQHSGNMTEALEIYHQIKEIDRSFLDVQRKIEELQAKATS